MQDTEQQPITAEAADDSHTSFSRSEDSVASDLACPAPTAFGNCTKASYGAYALQSGAAFNGFQNQDPQFDIRMNSVAQGVSNASCNDVIDEAEQNRMHFFENAGKKVGFLNLSENKTEETVAQLDNAPSEDSPSESHSDNEQKNVQDGKHKLKKPTKAQVFENVKYFALLIFLAFVRAFTSFVFVIPNGFAPGGIGGISSIIYNAVLPVNPRIANSILDPGLTTFLMNIPFLIAAFKVLNKRFCFNTLCVLIAYSGFMMLFNHTSNFPKYYADGDTGLQIIAAIVSGAITGVCLGVMLRTNMSMGGTDIVGKIIYKHNPTAGAQWWILICDCTVAFLSGILGIFDILKISGVTATKALTLVLSPIFFSYLGLITSSITADVMQSGIQSSLVFNIITDKPNEIARAISQRIHRGVTVSRAIGYYTGTEHEILVCVVSKKQINTVKEIIEEIDPRAFTYITKAREVAGKGFIKGM